MPTAVNTFSKLTKGTTSSPGHNQFSLATPMKVAHYSENVPQTRDAMMNHDTGDLIKGIELLTDAIKTLAAKARHAHVRPLQALG